MGLTITVVKKDSNAITLSITGQIDSNTVKDFDRQISTAANEPTKAVILDLAQTEYINSAAIAAVCKAKNALKRRNAQLIMINLQPQIEKVFEIMHLLPTLNVFKNTAELDEYLDKIQKEFIDQQQTD